MANERHMRSQMMGQYPEDLNWILEDPEKEGQGGKRGVGKNCHESKNIDVGRRVRYRHQL